MTRVFISHSSDDAQLAVELHDWLRGLGHEVFLDRDLHDGLAGGDDVIQCLHERLRWADAVVAVITGSYGRSQWCSAELGVAQSRGSKGVDVALGRRLRERVEDGEPDRGVVHVPAGT